jgi:hypothetical protein
MKSIGSVLKNMASMVILQVPSFDTSECVTMQFSATNDYNDFFVDMAHSRGWEKQCKNNDFSNDQDAQFHMIDLLNLEISIWIQN